MVLKIIANANNVLCHCDVVSFEYCCWPNPRQLQDLRRVDRSCSKDDFLTCEHGLPRSSCIGRKLFQSASIESMEISKLTSTAVARDAELVVAPLIPYTVSLSEDEVPPTPGN